MWGRVDIGRGASTMSVSLVNLSLDQSLFCLLVEQTARWFRIGQRAFFWRENMKSALSNKPVYPVESFQEDIRFHKSHLDAMNARSANRMIMLAAVVSFVTFLGVGAVVYNMMTDHNAARVEAVE